MPLQPICNRKILIVDDEAGIRSLCAAVLRRSGFAFLLAKDGQEGLEIFAEEHHKIDLVLTDAVMPGLDGIGMIRRILELKPETNVVLMTAFSPNMQLVSDEVCEILVKPFTVNALVETVEKCLSQTRPG